LKKPEKFEITGQIVSLKVFHSKEEKLTKMNKFKQLWESGEDGTGIE
jgi:hypothetical protein